MLACSYFGWTVEYVRKVPVDLLFALIEEKSNYQSKLMGSGSNERDGGDLAGDQQTRKLLVG